METNKLKKVLAALLAVTMMFSSINVIYAEDESETYINNELVADEVLSGGAVADNSMVAFSLLPLEEKEATLVLNGYTSEELKNFPVQKMIDGFRDSDGNYIEIPSDAKVLWAHFKDDEGNVIRDEYHEISRDETVDLTEFEYTTGYTMELIVGSENQLDPNNVRYFVRVYISDKIAEKIDLELCQEDENGNRTPFDYDIIPTETVVSLKEIIPDTKSNAVINAINYAVYPKSDYNPNNKIYFGLKSLRDDHPNISLAVFDPLVFILLYAFTGDIAYSGSYPSITSTVVDQDLSVAGTGYDIVEEIQGSGYKSRALYMYYNNKEKNPLDMSVIKFGDVLNMLNSGSLNSEEDFIFFNIVIMDNCVTPDTATINTYDKSEQLLNIEEEHSLSIDYDYSNIDLGGVLANDYTSLNGNTLLKIEYKLKEGYSADEEYYLKLNTDNIEKIVLGNYNSLDEAKNEVDLKEEFSGKGYKTKLSDKGVIMTFFYKSGNMQKTLFRAVQYYNEVPEFTNLPIVGKADPYFRLTEVEETDSYVIENGGIYNLDTYYGYGYQTVLVNEPNADLEKLKPEFWFAADDYFNLYKVDSDNRKLQDVNNPDSITKKNQQYALAWKNDDTGQKVRNYWLSVVKKTSGGPKLFVDGPENGETREVLLTDYFENKHDVFVANTGDEPMYISARLSDDAKNVKLDDYWTIGGENNQELKAFTTTEKVSDYSELPNVAKVRLLRPDTVEGDGAVSGQLIIEASGGLVNGEPDKNNEYYETYVIQLNDKAENPQIINESVSDAVKYVPYQEIIATDNIHEENIVTYNLTGELPDGVTFNEGTGEIYGVPKNTGEYTFTVQADFSDSSFESVEKEFTLNVKDNSDDNVASEIDEGFEIITPIDDIEVTEGEAIPELVFEFVYDYSEHKDEFQGVWLDGEKLTENIDYIVEDGSTKITLKSQTSSNDYSGSHTIAAEYRNNNNQVKKSAQNYSVKVNSSTNGDSTNGGSTSSRGSGGSSKSNRYTVSYDSNGGSDVQSQSVIKGQKISFLATPVKAGYVFAGWYTDQELTKEFDKNTAVTSSFKLYAKWERADCTVWFNANGGTQVNSIQIKGDNVIENLPVSEKEGYKFAGWFRDAELKTPFGAEDKITENTTLYAKWELIIPNEAPEKVSGFIDVEENAWYYDDINWAYDNNIMVGYNNAIFAPKNYVTGSNIVTIFAKLCGADVSEYSKTNVYGIADNIWYSNYVKWAISEGLVAAAFEPNKSVSRQDMAVMITKLMDYIGIDYSSGNRNAKFSDEMLISDEAKDSVTKLYNSEVIAGRDDNTFDPASSTTRGEIAALIHRIYTLNLLK